MVPHLAVKDHPCVRRFRLAEVVAQIVVIQRDGVELRSSVTAQGVKNRKQARSRYGAKMEKK